MGLNWGSALKGFSQGFGPAFEQVYGIQTRGRERREDRKDRLADLLAAQKREDARQAILDERYKTERADKQAALALTAEKERGRIAGLLGAEGVPLGRGADYVPTELESQMHSIEQAKAERVVREGAEKRMRDAEATAAGQGATIPPVGVRDPDMTPADVLRLGAEQEYEDEKKAKLDPKWTPPKDEDKGTQAERATAKMKVLREEYNASGTTPERQGVLASEALGLLPLLYGQATQTHTLKDAEVFLQGKGLPPKPTGTSRTKEPHSPEALSSEETEHLNAARNMQRTKNLFMAKYSDKEAKKNLTIQGQLSNWIKNVAGPAAGIEAWKDPSAARFFAEAENLSAKALQQTHQMMGGGAFSEPDRILYERTIPNTKTFSPVAYKAKLEAWSDGLDDYVDYMTARQKIAELPRLVSDMEPWQVMKFTGKKDDDGNVIIGKGMAEMLIENKLALNPETNKIWTAQGLLDYQRENAQHGFTKRDLLNFIAMLPYEVKPPRYSPPPLPLR